MIMITTPVKLYGRKVITDLALRSGSATAKDFSCQRGLNNIVQHFTKGDTLANIEYLFEKQVDFDSDIVQPRYTFENYNKIEEREEYEVGEPYSPAKDKTTFNDYFRRLEDICVDYFEDYISNLCFSIFNRVGADGAVNFDAEHRLQPTLISVDDDSATELADLQLREDVNEWSNAAKSNAIDNLPYVLKRLHNLSKYCGIHMISMIGSYLKAKAYNDMRVQTGKSKNTLKKNAVIAEGVYKCDAEGNIGIAIEVSNKSKRAADMFDWIIGANDMYPSYRDDLVNFLQYCKILNIDLLHDDLLKYNNEFMDGLTVLTLTPDTQYNQAVFDAIRDSNLIKPAGQDNDMCLQTISCFRDLCETHEVLMSVIDHHDSIRGAEHMAKAKKMHYVSALRMSGTPWIPNDKLYSWEDGFLHYNGELVILDTRLITKASFTTPRFIISELGYCVHISDTMYLEMMTIDCAYANMNNTYIRPDEDYVQNTWVWFS